MGFNSGFKGLKIKQNGIYSNIKLRSLHIPQVSHCTNKHHDTYLCRNTLQIATYTKCHQKPQFITCSTVSPLEAVCPSRYVGCCPPSAPSASRPPRDSAPAQSAGTQVLLQTPAVVTVRSKQCLIC